MTSRSISASEVQSAVQHYWRVLMEKMEGEMGQMYAFDSTVFNPFSARSESGPVSAARKEREYFNPETSFRAEITGPIKVQLLADDIAVASYPFRWRASDMEEKVFERRFDKAVRDGRATQVFVLTAEGNLRVVHEHLSDIWRDSTQQGR